MWTISPSIPRTTLGSRKPPRNPDGTYSARDVVGWLLAEFRDDATPPGTPSPELEKWRAIRRKRDELEYAVRLRELESTAENYAKVCAILTPIRQAAERWIRSIGDTYAEDWTDVLGQAHQALERLWPDGTRRRELVIHLEDGEQISIPLAPRSEEPDE